MKIKDNGRTLKLVKQRKWFVCTGCYYLTSNSKCPVKDVTKTYVASLYCWTLLKWCETIPSRLARGFIEIKARIMYDMYFGENRGKDHN